MSTVPISFVGAANVAAGAAILVCAASYLTLFTLRIIRFVSETNSFRGVFIIIHPKYYSITAMNNN